jgi:hypothetical protein
VDSDKRGWWWFAVHQEVGHVVHAATLSGAHEHLTQHKGLPVAVGDVRGPFATERGAVEGVALHKERARTGLAGFIVAALMGGR